jgi:hypothetical protein
LLRNLKQAKKSNSKIVTTDKYTAKSNDRKGQMEENVRSVTFVSLTKEKDIGLILADISIGSWRITRRTIGFWIFSIDSSIDNLRRTSAQVCSFSLPLAHSYSLNRKMINTTR